MKTIAIIIAGTDTDIGKTYVTATLASSLIHHGKSVSLCKPVQTGLASTQSDPDWIFERVEGITRLSPEDEVIVKCDFPASPEFACRLENKTLSVSTLAQQIRDVVTRCHTDFILIELAGGLLVPMNEKETNLDLIQTLGFEVVLVTQNKLGTVNHTLLSIGALEHANIPIKGYIINRCPTHPDRLSDDNIITLQKRISAPCLATLPESQNLRNIPLNHFF